MILRIKKVRKMSKNLIKQIENKTDAYILKISKEYLDLVRLEQDIFRIILLCEGFPVGDKLIHITSSGNDEKINQRRKILYLTFYSQKQDLLDSYFLKMSKLFDISNNNKTLSLANFIIFLEKNIRFFSDTDKVLKIIEVYKHDFEKLESLFSQLKSHRDQCLAHNDSVSECKHLQGITSKDTAQVLDVIFDFIFNLNQILGKKTIDKETVEEIKRNAIEQNYILLKQLEADVT